VSDEAFDVVVLGTGAAGLTAAIAAHEQGARVAVFEKADKVGGTSAWSGGQVWIPVNPRMAKLGKADSRDDAITYLMSMSHDLIDQALIEAYVDTGPEMVAFLEARTPVRFICVPDFPDYHPEHPGGKPGGGRTLECPPYSFNELGAWKERVTVSPYWPDVHITVGETTLCQAVPKEIPVEEKQRRIANDERGLGLSLVARLLRGCLDRGIEPRTDWAAKDLIIEDGAVAGVTFETPDGPRTVRTRNVVLATGGFEWNRDFVRAFLRGPMTHPVSVHTNTGDGLRMAMKAGAMLGNMREAWWMPVIELPKEIVSEGRHLLTWERTLPGSIMVNRQGRRFTNEAANYNAFGAAFHEQDVSRFEYANLPCWVIFDHKFFEKYGFGQQPGSTPEEVARPSQWVTREPTLAALAQRLNMPEGSLEATVDRWNDHVAKGYDPDFRRGESAYDLWWGDPTMKRTKGATMGALTEGPFYAVEVKSGALGTKGGPRTDTDSRVVDLDGNPIPGLYAAGNVMASAMGMTYGGGGGTLGPGMVFGFRAGRHAGSRSTAS